MVVVLHDKFKKKIYGPNTDSPDFYPHTYQKTEEHSLTNIVWGGDWLPHLNMSWNPSKFKILCLWFTHNLQNMDNMNTQDKYLETKLLFNF